jgi:hypothetical protein
MSLNHLASKNLHGNFASLKVNDVTIGGSGKQHIHFSANLNSNGVNFLNAFSKGSGGSVLMYYINILLSQTSKSQDYLRIGRIQTPML